VGFLFLRVSHSLVQFLVLDEADRLCEKGHFEALNHILHALRPTAAVKNTYVDPVADRIVAEKMKVMDMVDEAGDALPGIEPPAHSRRQTFLFSATLGVSTAQSARDGAQALVAAQAQQRKTDGDAAKIGKAKMRKAMEIASKLTPVEALMARVGTLGKPAVIKVDSHRASETGDDNSSEHSAGTHGTKATKATAITTKTAAGEMNPDANVALPPGLRLCRITCVAEEKDTRLYYFLLRYPGRTLIFVNAIAALKRLLILCSALKLPVTALHAHMQQRQRLASLENFRLNANGIMVATDVAARGLDIPSVEYVLHYGLPQSAEMFVHRCGRTARATASGLAAAIIDPKDQKQYVKIMNVLGMESGLPEFPVDVAFMRRIISRISLARKLTAAIIDTNRESSQQFFVMKTAKDSGLTIDDDLAADLGLDEITRKALLDEMDEPPTEPEPGTARPPKRRRSEPADYDDIDESGSIDADTIAEYKHKKKQGKKELVALRRELDGLLKQPLAPAGTSLKYITSNPLLHQTGGPMAATGGVRILPDADATSAPARRGSALLAPKVFLPSLAGADSSRHTSINTIAKETAIDTLAHKGKHVFIASKKERAVEPKRR
jgi:superfamily II DNA/RNA helicase